jgi:REP element-mobilizing transposase RayT
MTYDPDIHQRRSIRLRQYDYSSAAAYFVTICVHGRECLFSDVLDGTMRLNDAGKMVERVWLDLSVRYPQVVLDEFVVMPNHFHGIIVVNEVVGALLAAPGFKTDKRSGAASSAPTIIK